MACEASDGLVMVLRDRTTLRVDKDKRILIDDTEASDQDIRKFLLRFAEDALNPPDATVKEALLDLVMEAKMKAEAAKNREAEA